MSDADNKAKELAKRFWEIHPKEIQDMGITRQEFYEQEIRAALQPKEVDVECLINDWRFMSELEMVYIDGFTNEQNRDYASSPNVVNGLKRVLSYLLQNGHLTAQPEWLPTHKHKKRGTEYKHIGSAILQTDVPLKDYASLEIYQGIEGELWARQSNEFADGRFEILPTPPKQEGE